MPATTTVMVRPRLKRAAKDAAEKRNGKTAAAKEQEEEKNSSGKKRRNREISPVPLQPEKRQKTEETARRKVTLPGVPAPTSVSSFVVPDRPSAPDRGDDKEGHFQYELGDNLTSRYKVLSKMGEGTFGRVLECWDRKNKDYAAIKIVRNVQKYRDAAMIELEVLNTLESNDPEGQFHCVRLREWFDYRGHVCMVFEKLGLSLYDFLRKNSYRPFHIDLVRSFGRQLLESVAYLHDLTLIHTDLKPENILLESTEYDKQTITSGSRKPVRVPRTSSIKVIDFGSATFDDQYHSTIVSTRHYRAPEVILGLGWTFPADIWSIGCILVELATGTALFQTHENLEHLAMMQQVLGSIPEGMAHDANRADAKYFTHRHRLRWPKDASGRKSVSAVQKLSSLKKLLADHSDSVSQPVLDQLLDLLKQMLQYKPSERIRAKAALRHPFFKDPGPSEGGSSAPSASLAVAGTSAAAEKEEEPPEVIVLEDD